MTDRTTQRIGIEQVTNVDGATSRAQLPDERGFTRLICQSAARS